MSSTPATSFGSDDSPRHRNSKNRAIRKAKDGRSEVDTPTALPSPSLSSTGTEEPTREVIEAGEAAIIDEAYKTIYDAFCGILPSTEQNPTFQFQGQRSFEQLLDRIEKRPEVDGFFQNIRYNWNSGTGRLTLLLMAYPIHEAFKVEFGRALDQELDRLALTTTSLQPLREKLRQRGHVFVRELNKKGRPTFLRSPDGQLRYDDSYHPPFVFEVCWSHGDPAELAEEYFGMRNGSVSTLLCFDIDHQDEATRNAPGYYHSASIYLWHQNWSEADRCWDAKPEDPRVFRDAHGEAISGTLELPFEWLMPFSPPDQIPEAARDAKLHFDFERLAGFITQAEREQRKYDQKPPPPPPGIELAKWKAPKRIWNTDGTIGKTVTFEEPQQLPSRKKRRTEEQSDEAVAYNTRSKSRSRSRSQSRPRRSSRRRS
ncbi:hypothetical protein F4825DRAFT_11453 [Nemania diffusa]|nr:hypothetical protein F4825DRAFT_11453 [Nemania diffusa]